MDTFHPTIDAHSATALFEQVRTQIAAAVAQGSLSAGTRLPTVRRLAADLGLAPHTVARAYRELETDSVIVTRGRRGTFVRSEIVDEPAANSPIADIAAIADRARASAADYVLTARRLGLSSQEAMRLVENSWNEGLDM